MEGPSLRAARERSGENEVTAIRLVRPVIPAIKALERSAERVRRSSVRRMYKRINYFPVT
jgi:hypothetical protein